MPKPSEERQKASDETKLDHQFSCMLHSPSRLDDESGKKCKRKAEKKGEKLLPRKVFSGMLDESRRVGRIARRIPKPPRADDKWKATEMQHKRARTVDE